MALDESQLHCQQTYFPNDQGHLLYGELFLPPAELEARVVRRYQQVDPQATSNPGGLTSIFRAGVVLTHGFRAGRPDWDRSRYLARRFARQGVTTLCFDYRGVGQSQGDMQEASLTNYALDLGAAVDHLLPYAGRVAVVAHSFGGQAAFVRAAQDPRIAAVCTIGTPWHSLPIFRQMLSPDRYEELAGGRQISFTDRYGTFFLRPGFHCDLVGYDMIELVPKIAPRPLLLIYAGSDRFTPLEEGYALLAKAGEPKALEVVAGADHFFSGGQHRQALAAILQRWLAEVL